MLRSSRRMIQLCVYHHHHHHTHTHIISSSIAYYHYQHYQPELESEREQQPEPELDLEPELGDTDKSSVTSVRPRKNPLESLGNIMSTLSKRRIRLDSVINEENELNKKKRKSAMAMSYDNLTCGLEQSWAKALAEQFEAPYFQELQNSLQSSSDLGTRIFPPPHLVLNALNSTPLNEVKVVIIGQDPYHGEAQAEGMSFSVPRGIKVPSSLQNIFKELKANFTSFRIPSHGHLQRWAEQGVLLLNAVLTVEAHKANSHAKLGWNTFTDAILNVINTQSDGIIFLLWGKYAQKKASCIDRARHHVLESAHPSGLSAHRGFFGCQHFSKTNELLTSMSKKSIDWQI